MFRNKRLSELEERLINQEKQIQNFNTRFEIGTVRVSEEGTGSITGDRLLPYENWLMEARQAISQLVREGRLLLTLLILKCSYICNSGVEIEIISPDYQRELAYTERFLKENRLQGTDMQDIQIASEVEAKVCFTLQFDPAFSWSWIKKNKDGDNELINETGMAFCNYQSFTDSHYKILPDERNSRVPAKLMINNQEFTREYFVYAHYNGLAIDINSAQSSWSPVYDQICEITRTFSRQAISNDVFSAPKASLKAGSIEEYQLMNDSLEGGVPWNTRSLFLHLGDLAYLQPGALPQLADALKSLYRIIATATGIPYHHLNPEDVGTMAIDSSESGSNRLITQSRNQLKSWCQELVTKAMLLANGKKTAYIPEAVQVRVADYSQSNYDLLLRLFIPLVTGGIISKETMLELLPGVNAQKELERLEKQQNEENNAPSTPIRVRDTKKQEAYDENKRRPAGGYGSPKPGDRSTFKA